MKGTIVRKDETISNPEPADMALNLWERLLLVNGLNGLPGNIGIGRVRQALRLLDTLDATDEERAASGLREVATSVQWRADFVRDFHFKGLEMALLRLAFQSILDRGMYAIRDASRLRVLAIKLCLADPFTATDTAPLEA